jgi:probable HAF family extracellular repeat protein
MPDPNFGNFNPYVGQNQFLQHAFKFQNETLIDLGALPGANTSNAGWITEGGAVSGLSTRTTIDPLTGWPEEAAILWKDGQIIDLGTLGGYEAQANANNSRGQVAGFSANAVPDSFPSPICGCSGLPSYGTQQRAFLWENGVMMDLGTLGGPDSVALLINERGQVAGQSYTSFIPNPATGVPTVDPFLWDKRKMLDLGSLGGTFGGAGWINERGQVVGSSNLPGDLTQHPFLWNQGLLTDLGTLGGSFGSAIHVNDAGEVVGFATNQGDQAVLGFLWKNGVMTNLGTLKGDACSLGEHINSRQQIVGISSPGCTFSPGDGHAVLWESDGSIIDLNEFVPPEFGLTLFEPGFINDRGEIIGKGPLASGDLRAFLLIPCDENHPGVAGCDYSLVESSTPAGAAASSTAEQRNLISTRVKDRIGAMMKNRDRRISPWVSP